MQIETVKAPEAMRAWVEKEYDSTFWGMPVRVRPAMCPTVIGDGGKLAYLTPLNERPNHFAILVPSWYTEDDLSQRSEVLIQAIEASFGNADDERDDEGDESAELEDKWPCWSDGGHSYGFFNDIPDDIMAATREDIAMQLQKQQALFVGQHRVHPGTLLIHPEFGHVQTRHNETLGWHYCRLDTAYECMPGQLGYATDFSCVTVVLDSEGEPKYSHAYIEVRRSTPSTGSANTMRAGGGVGGVPAQVITGAARARAHYALLSTLGERSDAADEEALAFAKQDVSLFLEPIPPADPFGRGMHNVWSAQSTWYGNWLTKAAANGFPKTIEALMTAGVHPDDQKAFLFRPLIWHEAWHGRQELLELALKFGAEPDSPEVTERPGGARARPNRSLARKFLGEIRSNMLSFSIHEGKVESETVASLESNVRSLQTLLSAGARKLDAVYGLAHSDDGRQLEHGQGSYSAISAISTFLDKLKGHSEHHEQLLALVRTLHAAGASVTARHQMVAPVVDAIRGKDAATLETLLQLGAKVDDEDVVSLDYPHVATVLEEALAAGGPEWKAQVAETIMQHSMRAAAGDYAAPKPAARRRRGVTV